MQRTINKDVTISGVGLHSGKIANVKLMPAKENSGITFVRSDIAKNNEIKANFVNVSEVLYSTKLSNESGASVSTIEHLMAALWAMKITNLTIEIDSEETPIMSGSAQDFIFLIECVGWKKQNAPRKVIKIIKDVSIEAENRSILVTQSSDFKATFKITNAPSIISDNEQEYTFDVSKQSFINDISLARTFCRFEDIEKLKSMNLAKGGSLENAVVIKENSVLNENGLNYQNECVRHKILDLVGDISLCDYYIQGHFIALNSGHELNNKLMRKIFSDPTNYIIL